jgi:hypothetical protein
MFSKLMMVAAMVPVGYYTGTTVASWDTSLDTGKPGSNPNITYITQAPTGAPGPGWSGGEWPTGPGAPAYYTPVGGGSTDPNQFMGNMSYMYNLDYDALAQQANYWNYGTAENGPGAGMPYSQINLTEFNQGYTDFAMAWGSGDNAAIDKAGQEMANALTNSPIGNGYGSASVPSSPTVKQSNMAPVSITTTARPPAISIPATPPVQADASVKQAMLDAKAILASDSALTKDAATKADMLKTMAELNAAIVSQ